MNILKKALNVFDTFALFLLRGGRIGEQKGNIIVKMETKKEYIERRLDQYERKYGKLD